MRLLHSEPVGSLWAMAGAAVLEFLANDSRSALGFAVPVRALAALALVAILMASAGWAMWVLPRSRWMPLALPGRVLLALVVVLTLLALAAWVYFVLPAYWD